MRKILMIGLLTVAALGLAACGGSSSGGSTTPSITSIEALPSATSPMASSASAMVVKGVDVEKAAVTGLNFVTTSSASFGETSSMGACETFNVAKDAVSSAAQADQTLCYVKQMNDSFAGLTDASGNPVDVYDGEWHILNLDLVGADDGAPEKIKMRIVKDDAGNISSFQMFMCNRISGELSQTEYVDQTLSGTSFAMSGKGHYADAMWSGSHEVDVTGTLNSSGAFTNRVISVRNTGGEVSGSNVNWQESTFTQAPGDFVLSGYRYGMYTDWNGGQGTSQEATYGVGEMLGDTSTSVADLALGDGAVNVDTYYTWTKNSMWPDDPGYDDRPAEPNAWLGDGAIIVDPVTDSPFYGEAVAGTLPAVVTSQISIEFTAAETWDCSDDVSAAVTMPAVEESTIKAACDKFNMGNNWINCYQLIQKPHDEPPVS